MDKKNKQKSAENVTKGNAEDKHEDKLHPLKGTVKDDDYKDQDASKNRLEGTDKDKLEKQTHSATSNSNKKVADKIQNE
ncbi:hypothetical protein [Polaribacter sp. M15]|jgi:hypothetical protein